MSSCYCSGNQVSGSFPELDALTVYILCFYLMRKEHNWRRSNLRCNSIESNKKMTNGTCHSADYFTGIKSLYNWNWQVSYIFQNISWAHINIFLLCWKYALLI